LRRGIIKIDSLHQIPKRIETQSKKKGGLVEVPYLFLTTILGTKEAEGGGGKVKGNTLLKNEGGSGRLRKAGGRRVLEKKKESS